MTDTRDSLLKRLWDNNGRETIETIILNQLFGNLDTFKEFYEDNFLSMRAATAQENQNNLNIGIALLKSLLDQQKLIQNAMIKKMYEYYLAESAKLSSAPPLDIDVWIDYNLEKSLETIASACINVAHNLEAASPSVDGRNIANVANVANVANASKTTSREQTTKATSSSNYFPILPVKHEPLTYAKLANNAYYPNDDIGIPEGFQVFNQCPDKYQWWGYFGKTYFKINEENGTIDFIIAHRGTDNKFGIIEDARLWLTEVLPAQYEECAKPFIQESYANFKSFVADYYPNLKINVEVTGHSLGAALAEMTMLDSAKGEKKSGLPKMKYVGIENPGVPIEIKNNVMVGRKVQDTDLKDKERTKINKINKNVRKNSVLVNSRFNAIDTLYQTPSDFKFYAPVDNDKYPLFAEELPLPLVPSLPYYAYPYSFNVVHPCSGIVNYLEQNGSAGLKGFGLWPYGLLNGFDRWENYALDPKYWNGYMDTLWNDNGLESYVLQGLFDYNKTKFEVFYKEHFLYQHAPTKGLTEEESKKEAEKAKEDLKSKTIDGIDYLKSFNNPENLKKLWENDNRIIDKYKTFCAEQNIPDADGLDGFKTWANNYFDSMTPNPKEHENIKQALYNLKGHIKLLLEQAKGAPNAESEMKFKALVHLQQQLIRHNIAADRQPNLDTPKSIDKLIKNIAKELKMSTDLLKSFISPPDNNDYKVSNDTQIVRPIKKQQTSRRMDIAASMNNDILGCQLALEKLIYKKYVKLSESEKAAFAIKQADGKPGGDIHLNLTSIKMQYKAALTQYEVAKKDKNIGYSHLKSLKKRSNLYHKFTIMAESLQTVQKLQSHIRKVPPSSMQVIKDYYNTQEVRKILNSTIDSNVKTALKKVGYYLATIGTLGFYRLFNKNLPMSPQQRLDKKLSKQLTEQTEKPEQPGSLKTGK